MPGHIKSPGKRINRVTKTLGVVSAAGKAPRMPYGLCQQAQDAWRGFWGDVVSGVMRSSDTTIAVRWIRNVDRYHRLVAEADREPMSVGSTGQPCVNPIYVFSLKLEASIRDDEKQLGIGPLNRLHLGVVLSESAKTLADLNAEAHDATENDPRATLTVLADPDS